MYIIVETSINIIFAILIVSCFAKNQGLDHFNAINQILRFLASSLKKDIIFER